MFMVTDLVFMKSVRERARKEEAPEDLIQNLNGFSKTNLFFNMLIAVSFVTLGWVTVGLYYIVRELISWGTRVVLSLVIKIVEISLSEHQRALACAQEFEFDEAEKSFEEKEKQLRYLQSLKVDPRKLIPRSYKIAWFSVLMAAAILSLMPGLTTGG